MSTGLGVSPTDPQSNSSSSTTSKTENTSQTFKPHPELVLEQRMDRTEPLPGTETCGSIPTEATIPGTNNEVTEQALNNVLENVVILPQVEPEISNPQLENKPTADQSIATVEKKDSNVASPKPDVEMKPSDLQQTPAENIQNQTALPAENKTLPDGQPNNIEANTGEISQESEKLQKEETANTSKPEQEIIIEGDQITNGTTVADNENNTESESSKKALELVVESSAFNEESDENGIDINALSNQIFDILDEGRTEEMLQETHLKQKNEDLKGFIIKLIQVIKDKTELCFRLEKQNEALIQQAKSLKNVIAITKDLLGIRNMEVEHLHEDMKLLEDNINAERTRHDLLLQKLAESLKLNDSLKTEYHTQQGLFQSLREKYHEKIILLTRENQRLNNIVNGSNEETKEEENGEGINGSDSFSTETVEK